MEDQPLDEHEEQDILEHALDPALVTVDQIIAASTESSQQQQQQQQHEDEQVHDEDAGLGNGGSAAVATGQPIENGLVEHLLAEDDDDATTNAATQQDIIKALSTYPGLSQALAQDYRNLTEDDEHHDDEQQQEDDDDVDKLVDEAAIRGAVVAGTAQQTGFIEHQPQSEDGGDDGQQHEDEEGRKRQRRPPLHPPPNWKIDGWALSFRLLALLQEERHDYHRRCLWPRPNEEQATGSKIEAQTELAREVLEGWEHEDEVREDPRWYGQRVKDWMMKLPRLYDDYENDLRQAQPDALPALQARIMTRFPVFNEMRTLFSSDPNVELLPTLDQIDPALMQAPQPARIYQRHQPVGSSAGSANGSATSTARATNQHHNNRKRTASPSVMALQESEGQYAYRLRERELEHEMRMRDAEVELERIKADEREKEREHEREMLRLRIEELKYHAIAAGHHPLLPRPPADGDDQPLVDDPDQVAAGELLPAENENETETDADVGADQQEQQDQTADDDTHLLDEQHVQQMYTNEEQELTYEQA